MPTPVKKYSEKVGKRKTSIARVRLHEAVRNSFSVNDKPIENYFVTEELRHLAKLPLHAIANAPKCEITVHVKGGGIHSQAEAVALGIARLLAEIVPDARKPLKKSKMLTRDARIKERRKFGLKKARKSPQWNKR